MHVELSSLVPPCAGAPTEKTCGKGGKWAASRPLRGPSPPNGSLARRVETRLEALRGRAHLDCRGGAAG